MTTMVERVARAMYAAAAEAAATQDEYPGWNAELYFRRAAYVINARAAIAAMREPTKEMDLGDPGYGVRPSDAWKMMIDLALKD